MGPEQWKWEDGIMYDNDHHPVVRVDAYCDIRRALRISAAPDMALVLQEALKYGGDAKWMEDGEVVSLHERIRAVLAKAGVP
jgi:hypothetical protein